MELLTTQAATTMLAEQGGPLGGGSPPGDLAWNAAAVDPADAAHFEHALAGTGPNSVHFPPLHGGPSPASPTATLGDAILNQLESLKSNGDAMQAEILHTLGKRDLSPSEMLRVQYQLMSVSLEIQTTSNMAHHGVEDVKTIMHGQ
jgi:hypothetical protein